MRRREFITLVCGAALWPMTVHAQPSKPVIGFLRNTSPDESAYLLTALRKGLNETGYVEGENLAIEYRWGGGHQDRLRDLADDLIRHKVSLIIGGGDAAIIAAKTSTTALPIVFVTGEDPIKLGFVGELNQPGGTTTGVTFLSNTLRTKQLQLLHELVLTPPRSACSSTPKFRLARITLEYSRRRRASLG